jgi:integrase
LFGKGGKERLIPINDVLANVIGEEPVGRQDSRPDEPLFRNRKGRRYRSLRTPLSRARRVFGEEHCWHHSHRHRNATLQRKGGTDMVLISKLLGHANPTVTQIICVDPLPDDVRRTAKSS